MRCGGKRGELSRIGVRCGNEVWEEVDEVWGVEGCAVENRGDVWE